VLIQTGCAGRPAALGDHAATDGHAEAVAALRADWDDLDAALEIALTACELGVLARTPQLVEIERTDRFGAEPYPDRVETARRWRLVTRDGRRGELRAVRPVEDAQAGERGNAIELAARIGPFGTPTEERCLLDTMTARLEDLRGPGARPVDRD